MRSVHLPSTQPTLTAFARRRRDCLHALAAAWVAVAVLPSSLTLASEPRRFAPVPTLRLQGQAEFRWWGMHLYDARLWSARPVSAADFDEVELVLELEYARRFRGTSLADRSIQEMQDIEPIDDAQAQGWRDEMRALFPGVDVGDRLAAWHRPGEPLRFLFNERSLGEIRDPEFARRFLAVWLSQQSPAPRLHQALLGGVGQ